MNKPLKKAIFNMENVQEVVSPLSSGILFKPILHPTIQEGSAVDLQKGAPQIRHSTAQFTIKPGYGWPETIFHLAELYFIMEGTGMIKIDDQDHPLKKGDVVYVASGLKRTLHNTGKSNLVYFSITDPEWSPEKELQT